MTRHRFAAAVALVVIAAAGCGEKQADYTSLLSTTTTTTTTTSTEKPVTIAEYLESVGVVGEPVAPDKLTDLTVTMPQPPGWAPYESTDFAPGTRVIAKGSTYPTAMLMVFELNGDFDVAQAVQHGYADAERSLNFKRLNASTDNWRGFPSSMIEGSYDLAERRMHSYNRIVIPTGPPPANQRYLIQFTVTGYAERAVEDAPDVEAIIRGFTVARK
ncbi:MAG: LpqN/LpqT family lipoprotein [Mycobacterium sp.]